MFHGFSQVWTPVALASELARDKPLAVRVAGEPVVLFRDATRATVHALIDRCPHRGAALSLGRVDDGCLRCPFHGWRFGGDGACHEVPWHPDAKREHLSATALAAREVGGFIWIFTAPLDGVAAEAAGEPRPPAEVLRDDVALTGSTFAWRAHWTTAVENMADDSHLPWVHPKTIGRGMFEPRPESPPRLALDVTDHDWGWSWHAVVDGKRAEWAAELRWPNVMLLRIPAGSSTLGICFAAVPVDDDHVRILQLSYRSMLRPAVFHPVFRFINRRVLVEDQAIVESQPPGPPRPEMTQRSVPTDVVGLRFRKRVMAELGRPELNSQPKARGALPLAADR